MRDKTNESLARNPLEDDDVLTETFFRRSPAKAKKAPKKANGKSKASAKADKPTHYKVCCISLYTEDIERLDDMVAELKRRGYTKANKSALIRYALDTVDLDSMPKGY